MIAKQRLLRPIAMLIAISVIGLVYGFLSPTILDVANVKGKWVKTAISLRWIGPVAAVPPVVGAALLYRSARRKQDMFHQRLAQQGITRLILARADAPAVKDDQTKIWYRLIDVIPAGEHISWELSGGPLGISFSMRATEEACTAAMTQIMTEWAGTRSRIVAGKEDPLFAEEDEQIYWVELKPQSATATIKGMSPLQAALTQIAQYPEGLRGGVQVLARPNRLMASRLASKAAAATSQAGKAKKSGQQKRGEKDLDDRSQQVFLETRVLVWVGSDSMDKSKSQALSLARTIIASFDQTSNPIGMGEQGTGSLVAREFPLFAGSPWAANELATLAHLMGSNARSTAPQLAVAPARSLPPSPDVRIRSAMRTVQIADQANSGGNPDGENWITLGAYHDDWGHAIPVGFPIKDLRMHMSLFGTTGSGKSTLLRNLILQAFQMGTSVVVIEPHGDLILDQKEGVLAALPPEVLERVSVIDLTSAWPPQINLMSVGLGAGESVAVDTAMACLRVMEEASWVTAIQMRDVLQNSARLLLDVFGERASIVHWMAMMDNELFRERVVRQSSDAAGEARTYWEALLEDMAAAAEKGKKGGGKGLPDLGVPQRRLRAFLSNDFFRRSLCLPNMGNALDIGRLLDTPPGRPNLILVPLQSTKLGKAKTVFGTLFMNMVTNAFMSRADTEASARSQTMVMVDEFADMAGGAIGEIVNVLLAQARKFGASVVLATQSASQLPTDVGGEVSGNTNLKVFLRISGEGDAAYALKNLGGDQLTKADLLAIEKYHGYAKVTSHGSPQPPFYFMGMSPIYHLGDCNGGAGVVDVRASQNVAQPPSPSTGFTNIHRLAKDSPEEAIKRLAQLSEQNLLELAAEQAGISRYHAADIRANPDMIPDPVARALKISQLEYGMPWWLLESYYRKLRFQKMDMGG